MFPAARHSCLQSIIAIVIRASLALHVTASGAIAAGASSRPATQPTRDPTAGLAGQLDAFLTDDSHSLGGLVNEPWAFEPLDKPQADQVRERLVRALTDQIRREDELTYASDVILAGGASFKLLTRQFGTKPADGWPLFISLHGGGNAPPEVNDQQWQNQIRLYAAPNALFVAPRAPSNEWNLWHEPHVDPLIDRLITDSIVMGAVNPNRIYLMGYSAGGDGVYQLAPRMADRFAAASMMAGHPNDAKPDGLRDLPFAIHVGAMDDGYGRNKMAIQWGAELDQLHQADPGGYVHLVQLHAGQAHWMHLEDRSAVPWMAQFTRDPLPPKVVWRQGHVLHERFYWLAVPAGTARFDQLIVADRSGQKITIEKASGLDQITVLLNDAMVDLDHPITIEFQGKPLFEGIVRRTIAQEAASLEERGDPSNVFDAAVTVKLPDQARASADVVSHDPATVDSPDGVDPKALARAVNYLRGGMPRRDIDTCDTAFLTSNAADALRAKSLAPWAKEVPDEIFLEDVLPYCALDESRDDWRWELTPIARRIVGGIQNPGEAARRLNAELFNEVHVRYDAQRRPFPNQSPTQTIACGFASCTGLSILLVDACRAVDIPARVVGIASWMAPSGPTYNGAGGAGGGNHTWVEIWDGRQWRFLGASEPSELDKTWFVDAASRSAADVPLHSIFAAAFTQTGDHFRMLWDPMDATVPAVNVTPYYSRRASIHVDAPPNCTLAICDAGRIVAAGEPGDFIVARGRSYLVRTYSADGQEISEKMLAYP